MNSTNSATFLNAGRYGRLCARVLPKVIESETEFDRMVDQLEDLDSKPNPSAEETALISLLAKLIEDYDHIHYPLPDIAPHQMVAYLMEQRGLKQIDLVEILGSRAQVSDLVNGKRSISKSQAKKLAAFFHVSTDLFL
ncbi:MAG: helix-turn-helix domain-containing protein [Bryobacterales bacterium]|nr:helix-turn-helix domain-containing protein [Bryobacterales bacterium]MBV9396858.1 helix-turn-helix domain-containing protein [Bryobacterales bacterium]